MTSIRHMLSVFVQRTLLVLERRGLELQLPLLQFLWRLVDDIDHAVVGIDADRVAVSNKADGSAGLRFRRDMADQEPTVAHDGRRGLEHLWHARAALRAFVPDDDDYLLALGERVGLESCDEVVLGVEAASLASEHSTFLTGDLAHRAFRCERPAQDLDVTDGKSAAFSTFSLTHEFDQRRCAADVVKVLEDVLARGLKVSKERGAVGYSLEVVNGQVNTNRVCHGDEMQDGVGTATGDVDKDHSILESLTGHDVGRSNVFFQEVLDGRTSGLTFQLLRLAGRRVG
ncbi:putative dihydroxy-acid dehydratase [Hortaea werneckii]|nr:putative dihydroxy-acid dehydratase [Hortaea werneckii]